MSEMIIQKESLTAIADEIRILSGTEGTMGLDAMKSNVSEANANVDTEADLIAQISAALEGKASGGGSGASVETCTLNYNSNPLQCFCVVYVNGALEPMCSTKSANSYLYSLTTENLVCGSVILLEGGSNYTITANGAEYLRASGYKIYYKVTAAAGEEVSFTMVYG